MSRFSRQVGVVAAALLMGLVINYFYLRDSWVWLPLLLSSGWVIQSGRQWVAAVEARDQDGC